MEDRFKFRLYDKSICEMVYDVCVGFIKAGLKEDWVCADTTCGQITYTGDKLKDIILMQSTGLKDKNGKLIYENDIVADVLTNKFTINFDEKYLSFLLTNIKTKESMVFYPNIKLEIIGNTFENKELLNEI